MKKYAALLLVLLVSSCVTTRFISLDEPFVRVFDNLPGTKSELFITANKWMVGQFNNAQSVIQYSDKEEGVIIGKYFMTGLLIPGEDEIYTSSEIYSQLDIRVKDGRARIEVNPSAWKYDPAGTTTYTMTQEQLLTYLEIFAESLRQALMECKLEF
ncbi:MAG: DUF4468 domain-containing protein [Deltaproteobacteria bacterium]|nr:DUF4468 domain-containing protein [Deltaproteobacteria bacterium]